jgi:hypothetical protein
LNGQWVVGIIDRKSNSQEDHYWIDVSGHENQFLYNLSEDREGTYWKLV